jgi:integrase
MSLLAPTSQSVLHRPADRPAPGEPAHDRRLPRHAEDAARIRLPADRQGAEQPGHRRSRRAADRRVPRSPPRARARQHDPHPQRPTRRDPLLFGYAALKHPEHAATIQRVLAIPAKRHDQALVTFLTDPELDALLAAPDRSTWIGRRDHALILLAAQTGLRASELTGLTCSDLRLGTGAHVNCIGKGRKQRITPLTTQTVAAMSTWADERAGRPDEPLFATSTGRKLSRDALERRLAKHAATATTSPSLQARTITPHVLRHTAVMRLLHAGVDTTVIAL